MNSAPITVLIPTIPGRESMLARALESINFQTVEPAITYVISHRTPEKMLAVDHLSWQMNQLLESVETPWVMRLADDDWFEPNHIEEICYKIVETHSLGTVYYSYEKDGSIPQYDSTTLTRSQLLNKLDMTNWIDGTGTAISTQSLMTIGGFAANSKPFEDWATWYEMAKYMGFRTVCVPKETWHAGRGNYERIGGIHGSKS